MVGKRNEGFFDPAYLPVSRGFNTSSGFLGGGVDHMHEKLVCATDFWRNKAPDTCNGTYVAYIYQHDLTEILNDANPNEPYFLYLPLHNVHGPFQAPEEWLNKYDVNSTCGNPRTYQAMVSVADNVTGHVVELLKKKRMWANTILDSAC